MTTPAYTWGLTTSANSGPDQASCARGLAEAYGGPYLDRGRDSLQALKSKHALDYLLVLDRNKHVFLDEPPLHWNPAMSMKRLRRLFEGGQDLFLSAVSLAQGDKLLDCTIGLGADALMAAAAVGEAGQVLGLEASPIIALLTGWGFAHETSGYDTRKTPFSVLAQRISVLHREALVFLETQPSGSWDVVYIDPMFRAANLRSSNMNALRALACHTPFSAALLMEAQRVCAKRVVLKERWFSPLFARYGAVREVRSKYGPVAYGIWE